MYQYFTSDLSEQQIFAQGNELATMLGKDRDAKGNKIYTYDDAEKVLVSTLPQPVLVSDTWQVMQVKDYITRETVNLLINKSRKITEYNGLVFDFDQQTYPTLRWPNIDTLLFCQWLKNCNLNELTTAAEIGCGSGFISQYVLTHAPELQTMDMYDINPYAEKYFLDHCKNQFPQSTLTLGDARQTLLGKQYDLLMCNPPYIPRPESVEDNAYEGLELLTYLINQASSILTPGGVFVTNISSVSRNLIAPIIAQAGLQSTVLVQRTVPLKVFNVLNNPDRLDYLVTHHNLILDPHQGHDYRHELTVLALTVPKS